MYISFYNNTLYYEKYGVNKKTILILSGWGETRPTWTNIINFLKQDYTVYILDYPGFGNSKPPKKDLTLDDYTNIVIKFMKKLKIKNPHIIAHSFGGRITANLVGKRKIKVDKILLIDVAGIKHKKTPLQIIREKLYKFLKKLTIVLPDKHKEKYLKKLFSYFASSDYNSLAKEMHQTFKNIIQEDSSFFYKEIKNETLLLWGNLDTSTPLKDAYKLNKLIKNSALIILKDASHFPYLDYPYLTNKIIHEFFK